MPGRGGTGPLRSAAGREGQGTLRLSRAGPQGTRADTVRRAAPDRRLPRGRRELERGATRERASLSHRTPLLYPFRRSSRPGAARGALARIQAAHRGHAPPYRLARAGPRVPTRAGGREDPGVAKGIRATVRLGGGSPKGRSAAGGASVADREGAGVHREGFPRTGRGGGSDVLPEPAARARRGGARGVRRGFPAEHLPRAV